MWDVLKRHSDKSIAAGLALAMLALYGFTLAPSVLYGDSGELQLAAARAGIAHPTGYPLYLILGWLWTILLSFIPTPAARLNLFSAVTATATVTLLYFTARRFLRLAGLGQQAELSRGVAFVAALWLGVSRLFWSQAVIAEVYALNSLIVVSILFVLLGWLEGGAHRRELLPLALLLGFGLAHHRTTLLLVPGVAVTLWLSARAAPARRLTLRSGLLLAGALLLPLLLYLYIPLRAPHSPYLTVSIQAGAPLRLYDNTLPGFLYYVLGRVFQGSIQFSLLGPARLEALLRLFVGQLTWAGVLLGLAGLAWLAFKGRGILVASTLVSFVSLVAFNLVYAIGDIDVYYIAPLAIWSLWVAVGIAWLAEAAGGLVVRWKGSPARPGFGGFSRSLFRRLQQLVAWLFIVVVATVPFALLAANLPAVSRRHDLVAWTQWQQILAQPLPEGAVLVSNDRDDIMPLWYFQQVEGLCPDLIGVFPKIVADGRWDDVGMVLDRALESGRPVYLIKPMPGMDVKVALEPAPANMTRVLGPATACESARPLSLVFGDTMRLNGVARSPYSVAPGQDLSVTLCWEPLLPAGRNYSTFVQLLDRAGNRIVGSDQIPGGVYYPVSLWKPGEKLRDTHRLAIPADLAPGAYRLYAGMYLYPSMERLGDADLGFVGVKMKVETERREPPSPTEYYFEDKILLLGYELRKEGQSLLLSLEWQGLREMEYNYTTFVHLVDERDEIASQADGQPLGGSYPTSIWDRNEIVIDAYRLPIEMDMPKGQYRLLVGLYRLETMQRLAIFGPAQTPVGDYVQLQGVAWP